MLLLIAQSIDTGVITEIDYADIKIKKWLIKQREIKAQGNLFNIKIDDRLKAQRDSIRKK